MTMFYNAFNRVEEGGGGGGTVPDHYVKLDVKCHESSMAGKTIDVFLSSTYTDQEYSLGSAKLSSVVSADGYYHVAGDLYITQQGRYIIRVAGEFASTELYVSTIDNSTVTVIVYPTLYGLFDTGGNNKYTGADDISVIGTLSIVGGTITDYSSATLDEVAKSYLFNSGRNIGKGNLSVAFRPGSATAPDKNGNTVSMPRCGGLHIRTDRFANNPVKAVTFYSACGTGWTAVTGKQKTAPDICNTQWSTPLNENVPGCVDAALLGVKEDGTAVVLGRTQFSRTAQYEAILPTVVNQTYASTLMQPITIDCADNDTAYSSYVLVYGENSNYSSQSYISLYGLQMYTANKYSVCVNSTGHCYEFGSSWTTAAYNIFTSTGAVLLTSRGCYSVLYQPVRIRGLQATLATTPNNEQVGLWKIKGNELYDMSQTYSDARRNNLLLSAAFDSDGIATYGDLTVGTNNTGVPTDPIFAHLITKANDTAAATRIEVKNTKLIGDACFFGYHRSHGDTRL